MSRLRRGSIIEEQKGIGLPREYQEVEYLESTGTQWIDSNWHFNKDLYTSFNFSIDFCILNYSIWNSVCGVDNSNNGSYQYYLIQCGRDINKIRAHNGDTESLRHDVNADIGIKHHINMYYNNNETVYTVNNIIYSYQDTINGLNSNNLYLFCNNNCGSAVLKTKCRIYSISISSNNNYQLYFIPCYRISDSKPCMYDLVSQQPFFNRGTGADFILGPDVY